MTETATSYSLRQAKWSEPEAAMHPHSSPNFSRAERDAVMLTNQRVLIKQLEARVRSQQRYIAELEMLVGRRSSACRTR
jgi:hypothetical protein